MAMTMRLVDTKGHGHKCAFCYSKKESRMVYLEEKISCDYADMYICEECVREMVSLMEPLKTATRSVAT